MIPVRHYFASIILPMRVLGACTGHSSDASSPLPLLAPVGISSSIHRVSAQHWRRACKEASDTGRCPRTKNNRMVLTNNIPICYLSNSRGRASSAKVITGGACKAVGPQAEPGNQKTSNAMTAAKAWTPTQKTAPSNQLRRGAPEPL